MFCLIFVLDEDVIVKLKPLKRQHFAGFLTWQVISLCLGTTAILEQYHRRREIFYSENHLSRLIKV